MRSLLLFDFDGVLVDSLDFYAEAVARCLERIGMPIVRGKEDYLDLFDGNFYESLAARGVDLSAYSRAAREILPGLDYGTIKPMPGLVPVLAALHRDHCLAVLSSNGSRVIAALLGRFGFAPFFREIFGSDFLFSKKEKIAFAVRKYGMELQRTFYVGDTAGDMVEARQAGVKAVGAVWGWHGRERLAKVAPDFLIETPAELLALL